VACLNYQVRAELDPVLVPGADCLTPCRIVECGKGAFGRRDVFRHGTVACSPSAATHYMTGLKSLASKANRLDQWSAEFFRQHNTARSGNPHRRLS
jgi:hypothetical protein